MLSTNFIEMLLEKIESDCNKWSLSIADSQIKSLVIIERDSNKSNNSAYTLSDNET